MGSSYCSSSRPIGPSSIDQLCRNWWSCLVQNRIQRIQISSIHLQISWSWYYGSKLQAPLEEMLFPEGLLRDALNITIIVFTLGCFTFQIGRMLAFHNLNMWS